MKRPADWLRFALLALRRLPAWPPSPARCQPDHRQAAGRRHGRPLQARPGRHGAGRPGQDRRPGQLHHQPGRRGKGRTCCGRTSTASPTTTCCRRARRPPASRRRLQRFEAAGRGQGLEAHDPVRSPRPDRWRSTRPSSVENDGKTTWNDPGQRHAAVLPAGGRRGQGGGEGTAPGRHAVPAPTDKTSQARMSIAVDFAIKPGETRFDLTYTVPYTEGAAVRGQDRQQGREHLPDRAQRRDAEGRRLKDLGTEPRTQAHIYGLHRRQRTRSQLTGSGGSAAGGRCRAATSRTTAARRSSRSCRACTARRG